MGIYIPDVKLPPDKKYKWDLVLHISYDGTVRSPWGNLITDGKAIELPMHGDLIDRNVLEVVSYHNTEGLEDTFDNGVKWMLEYIDKLTPVISADGGTDG